MSLSIFLSLLVPSVGRENSKSVRYGFLKFQVSPPFRGKELDGITSDGFMEPAIGVKRTERTAPPFFGTWKCRFRESLNAESSDLMRSFRLCNFLSLLPGGKFQRENYSAVVTKIGERPLNGRVFNGAESELSRPAAVRSFANCGVYN